MSRFDKYNPVNGGFRAPLNAAISSSDIGKVQAVSLNGSGRVVIGGAAAALVGVICPVRAHAAGEIIDVMTSGEITDFTLTGGGAAAAGTVYYSDASGVTVTTAPAAGTNSFRIGHTVELDRLVVRAAMVQG